MTAGVSLSVLVIVLGPGVLADPQHPDLPVLFSFNQPSHNVAIFHGAALQRAIGSGAVAGFGGGLGGGLAGGRTGAGRGNGLSLFHGHVHAAPAPQFHPIAAPAGVLSVPHRVNYTPTLVKTASYAPILPHPTPPLQW